MNVRAKSALLWGVVGALSFLVALQGYALARGPLVSIGTGAAIALGVGTGAAASAYVVEPRLAEWAADRKRG